MSVYTKPELKFNTQRYTVALNVNLFIETQVNHIGISHIFIIRLIIFHVILVQCSS